jgi:hypothetical protein
MNLSRRWIASLSLVSATLALAETPPVKSPSDAPSHWNFEFLPRAFQKNPPLDMTVITEVTDLGKKLPPVSPQAPAYYTAYSSGYHSTGDNSPGKALPASEVEGVLQHALATSGYLPATAQHPATLAVFYFWGAHTVYDQDNPALSDEQWTKNILERAALAGGEKFAAELDRAIQQSDALSAANSSRLGGGSSDDGDSTGNLGAAAAVAQMNAVMNPVRLLAQRSAKNQFLVDQASADCYYVVASAYDYSSVAAHVKKLLWRTRMTVNATGVSQLQSMPALIAAAGPYFGRDMAESEVMTKRATREGQVEVGTPTVVELSTDVPPAKK